MEFPVPYLRHTELFDLMRSKACGIDQNGRGGEGASGPGRVVAAEEE